MLAQARAFLKEAVPREVPMEEFTRLMVRQMYMEKELVSLAQTSPGVKRHPTFARTRELYWTLEHFFQSRGFTKCSVVAHLREKLGIEEETQTPIQKDFLRAEWRDFKEHWKLEALVQRTL